MIAGIADGSEPEGLIDELRGIARRARLDLLAGVHGHRLVVVLGGTADPLAGGAAVRRPVRRRARSWSARPWPTCSRPRCPPARRWPACAPPPPGRTRRGRSRPADLLPERALDGDDEARAELIEEVYQPLLRGGSALLDTVTTYLEQGNSLEATARLLFVHPNTVRYRLRRVSELTGLAPGDGRDGFTLWVAVVFGRLARSSAGTQAEHDL